jgi:hypothetical protein
MWTKVDLSAIELCNQVIYYHKASKKTALFIQQDITWKFIKGLNEIKVNGINLPCEQTV